MKELIEQIEKILDELTIESYYSESLHENDYMITGKAKCAEAIVKLLLPGPGAEQALTKYDSIGKIFRQLKSCNYENEAGPLDNNVAFIALERMASLAPVPAMERERIIEIFKNEFGHQPTISNKFRLQGIEWLFLKLAPEKPAEVSDKAIERSAHEYILKTQNEDGSATMDENTFYHGFITGAKAYRDGLIKSE